MTEKDRLDYARHRLKTSYDTFNAGKILYENQFYNSSVNRLYYSLFYAVNALLVLNKISTKSHSATKSQFSRYFIKTNKFDKKYGKLLSELYDWRQKGDYDIIYDFKDEDVKSVFKKVLDMIDRISNEINNDNSNNKI